MAAVTAPAAAAVTAAAAAMMTTADTEVAGAMADMVTADMVTAAVICEIDVVGVRVGAALPAARLK